MIDRRTGETLGQVVGYVEGIVVEAGKIVGNLVLRPGINWPAPIRLDATSGDLEIIDSFTEVTDAGFKD